MEIITVRDEKLLDNFTAEQFQEFINSLINENALILRDKEVSLKEEERWLKNIKRKIKNKSVVLVLLVDKEKIAGICEVRRKPFRQSHNVDFGLAVRREYRGKGYGRALLKKGIEEALSYLKAKNLWISYIDGNIPAKNLYEKLGFKEVFRFKEYSRVGNYLRDEVLLLYKK